MAADVRGVDLAGRDVAIAVTDIERWTLLLFLSVRCDGCEQIWDALRRHGAAWPEVDDVCTVVIVRQPDAEALDALRRRAHPDVPLVVSDSAHETFRVYGPPFFVLVDGARSLVATEGVAWGVAQVADDVRKARAGHVGTMVPRLEPPVTGR
jgi:hypothetical protein